LNDIYEPVDDAVIGKLHSEIDELKKIVDSHINLEYKANF